MNSIKNKLNSEIIFIFYWYPNGGLPYFIFSVGMQQKFRIIKKKSFICLNSEIIFIFYWYPNGGLPYFIFLVGMQQKFRIIKKKKLHLF